MSLNVTASPHIRSKETTPRIMLDLLIALSPAIVAGVWAYGIRALMVMLVTVVSCVVAELLFNLAIGHPSTINDCSAAVTGLILSMILPATVPYWICVLGGAFAVIVVKGLFGGIGENIFNPALAARAFLLMFWPVSLVRFAEHGSSPAAFAPVTDALSAATPLHSMQMPSLPSISLFDMFIGRMPGTIGEISALAILIGGAYLVVRRVITPRIPLAYLGTVAILTLIFSKGQPHVQWMLYSLLSGGVLFGAVFMATDYSTAPATVKGQTIYGVGCGIFTVIFRYFGLFPEGVTYAILLMNALSWGLDKVTAPRRFGMKKGGA